MLPPQEKCSPTARSDDDAHARVGIERLEHEAKLVALRHDDDVERRPVEDHIAALARGIDLDAEAVEVRTLMASSHHSLRSSPATSRRRKILPTGDFGISSTKT